MQEFLGMLVAVGPFLLVGGLLSLAGRREARRAARVARQIELTDAIHRELGAVAAPEVTMGPGGAWVVRMRVPLHHEALVGSLARITQELFARLDGPGPRRLEIQLSHREPGTRRRVAQPGAGAPAMRPEPATSRLRAA